MELKPGYKQTEVGVIPHDWEVKQLGALVSYTNGKAHEQSITDYGRYVVVNSKFISTEGEIRKYSDHCYSPTSVGDVLMVMSDVPNGRAIAKCFWVDREHTYTVNQRICALHPRQIDGKLLFYKLDKNPFYLAFDDGVKQTNLRKDDVLSCPLGIPKSDDEQRAIAGVLGDVDALLGVLQKLIAKKRNLKQAAMQQLLTGQTRLPGFTSEWDVNRLGDVVEIVNGGTPSTNVPAYWEGGIKWCTPTDITGTAGKYLTETERTISPAGLHSCSARLLPAGALLLCSRATIGEVKIAACEVCTNQGFKSLIPGTTVNNEFLYYLLLTMKAQMVERAIGSTFLEISKKDTAALEIRLPLLQEQTAISEVLSDMDAEIGVLEQRLAKTRALKQGMMQELLTGKTRLI
jgi:type I restriction enzyme S subunit